MMISTSMNTVIIIVTRRWPINVFKEPTVTTSKIAGPLLKERTCGTINNDDTSPTGKLGKLKKQDSGFILLLVCTSSLPYPKNRQLYSNL
ncbi:unnamed protein product [Ixodes pacificus]